MTAPPDTVESQRGVYLPQTLTDAGEGMRTALDLYKAGNFEAVLIVCRQVEEQYPGTAWYQRSLFLAEQALIQLGRSDEANAAMLRVQTGYPDLADYAVSILADHHFARGRYAQAAALYQQVVERYPESSGGTGSKPCLPRLPYAARDQLERFRKTTPTEFAPDCGVGPAGRCSPMADLMAAKLQR
jgi:TolA-binding protein